jgi:alcohol dehydrogenase (cytochrome c)
MSQGSRGSKATVLAALALLGLALGVLSGCGDSEDATGDVAFEGSAYPGVDQANTRAVKGSINRDNVSSLEVAWTLPITGQGSYGAYAATPVIVNGVIYSQDLGSNVQAIDLESGEVHWEKRYDDPSHGPNGVVVDEGKVFAATSKDAFALDQETGKELWSTPISKSSNLAVDMAPGYHDGLVYIASVPETPVETYPVGGVGTLWALDAKTGKKKWSFKTVPADLWGDPETNSGGGVWYPPSFDEAGGIYFGTADTTPVPGAPGKPWGASRPGPNLYTNSLVKLDAKTGKMDWFHQQTPHGVYDWDFQASPVLTEARGRRLAIGAGKSGFVVAVDAKTGDVVWERAVGKHNGHDDDGLLAMRGEADKIKLGEVYPGSLGGVIAPLAANATTVFAPVVNHPVTIVSGSEMAETSPVSTGELVAIDIASGKIKWSAKFEAPAYGGATVSNDVVFTTTSGGIVHAIDAESGGELWQAQLPAGTNSGIAIGGDTLIAPAGLPMAEGQTPQMVAYRLPE